MAEGTRATTPKLWARRFLRSLPPESDTMGEETHVCFPSGAAGRAPRSGCSPTDEKRRHRCGPTLLKAEMCPGSRERDTHSQGHRILLPPQMAALTDPS